LAAAVAEVTNPQVKEHTLWRRLQPHLQSAWT
jgi:hypothetical protein